jgi:hypothetical protein
MNGFLNPWPRVRGVQQLAYPEPSCSWEVLALSTVVQSQNVVHVNIGQPGFEPR